MKFDFRIDNYDADGALLHVRYRVADSQLGLVRKSFRIDIRSDGTLPDYSEILHMIRSNPPVEYWQRQQKFLAQGGKARWEMEHLVGYEETGVEAIPENAVGRPSSFRKEALI